jgi:hypothetical protein
LGRIFSHTELLLKTSTTGRRRKRKLVRPERGEALQAQESIIALLL